MTEDTLLQACRLLFGEEVVVGEGFLDYLQPGGLKNAYRQRARQTHPDARPKGDATDFESFHAVQQAFSLLSEFIENRKRRPAPMVEPVAPRMRPAGAHPASQAQEPLGSIAPIILESHSRPGTGQATIDRLYQGPLPERSLLFGHFLYYSGLTTWRTITTILVQQQRGRPKFGEMGTRLGLLIPEDINRILKFRTPRRPFGEVAVSLGLLNSSQKEMVLLQQRRQQKKFGTILVEKDLITLGELCTLLTHFRCHNREYENQAA
ncbi:J domain-containing protein [Desulfobulbus rhabdoformis]|uniref:DnaJ domain-containing protein n=1 Tax=Desulfobulbus rhabdoformis TaxID=34032 RepID=UPI001964B47E|nr:J domain-containing protein [Desulfobulbus rhabdoformis]